MTAIATLTEPEAELLLALPGDHSVVAVAAIEVAERVSLLKAADELQRRGLVVLDQTTETLVVTTDAGETCLAKGLPERRLIEHVLAQGPLPMRSLSDAGLDAQEAKAVVGWIKKAGWATIERGEIHATVDASPPAWEHELALEAMQKGDRTLAPEVLKDLRSRGLLQEQERREQTLALTASGVELVQLLAATANWRDQVRKENTQITPELLRAYQEASPEVRDTYQFKSFDVGVAVEARPSGKMHPISRMMREIRQVLMAMGFQEISGDYVENAFWNMDRLFIPQDHPARDMQDTFYLRNPASIEVPDVDLEAVGAIHESGGETGSRGWGGSFSKEVSQRALLRTHTTNTTVRYLADHPEGHHKVFGLGKVFRKETMDATHLPEFHQIEGICTEPGANFDMLIGICKVFFAAMGFPETRFRPAYFPYTEPSMEIDVKYHGRWMELGGCGIFRPEVTEPLGVEHPVLAWGFGLERLAMMRLGLRDIRGLYLSDLQWLQEQEMQPRGADAL